MNSYCKLAATAITTILTAATASPVAADDKDWHFELAPYLWATGLNGDALIQGQPVEVDQSFSDLFEALEIGGGLLMRAERGHWVFWTQADYFSLSTDELDDPPERGKLDVDTTLLTVGFGREFESSNGRRSLDVLLGARYLDIDGKLRFPNLGTFKNGDNFTDPVIILRPSFQISERWRLNPTFSYGTGGDSESTYELQPQVQFQMNDRWALRFGYRKLHYDIDNEGGNGFDGAFEGPIIGVSGTFGGSLEPVAPPPPPPPVAKAAPPPPPPPGDADKDGVTDDKDRCPNTAVGIQVDQIGCFREVTLRGLLFETDSAELNAHARTQLDTAAQNFKALPADVAAGVSVVVEGHTDSTGSDAYNLALSQRRADAARDYLVEKGLPASIITARGQGEASPTDSNDTPEGRANNRRVVIKAAR